MILSSCTITQPIGVSSLSYAVYACFTACFINDSSLVIVIPPDPGKVSSNTGSRTSHRRIF